MNRLFLTICGLLAAFMPALATASIFDLPSTDQAGEWIAIFKNNNIISKMSVVLNLACLGFSTVIIGYTVVSGILNTAHEGNVMGKAYSSMWVPLRTTIAIALMLPLSDGFCIMQHGVLWVAKTGLAVAYHTWSAAVDHLQNNGTLYAPPVNRTGEKLAAAIMRNSACLDIINRSHGEMKVGRVNEAKNNSDEYTLKVRYTGNGRPLTDYFPYASNGGFKDWVEIDGCGTASITFQKPDQDDLSYPIKIQYMDEAQRHFGELADTMYTFTHKLIQEEGFRPVGDELHLAAKTYNDKMAGSLAQAVKALSLARSGDLTWLTEAKEKGFTNAGVWYFDIMRLHEETFDFVSIAPTTTTPKKEVIEEHEGDFVTGMESVNSYLAHRTTYDKYGDPVIAATQNDEEGVIDGLTRSIQASIAASIENQQDPTLALQNMGHTIITTMEVAGLAAGAAKVATEAGDSSLWVKLIPGGGATAGAINAMSGIVFNLVLGVAFLIGVPALFLAFYLPLIPFILWVLGLAGWAVLLIEAIVAAPLWAAAHSIPDGQNAINQHARAGYMIILSLFMRPTLMLFGLFASFYVNIIIGKFALKAYLPMVLSVSADHTIGIVSLIAYTGILTVLMVMVAHRAFGLIHEIPDKILRFIGAGMEQLGESKSEQQGMSMIAGVARRGERGKMPGGKGGKGGAEGSGDSESNSLSNATKGLENSLSTK